jgi:hypothetical protein
MLVAMKSATGSYLTPTIAAFPNSASSTVFSIPAFCAPATSGYIGAGRIDPTVANYIGMISNQSNSVGWGLRSITGVFELVQP